MARSPSLPPQVPAGRADHAQHPGRGAEQGRRGRAFVPAVPQREPAEQPAAVPVRNAGEVLLQADVHVGPLLHPGGGDHPCGASGHPGQPGGVGGGGGAVGR